MRQRNKAGGPLPLIAWGEAMHRHRLEHHRRVRCWTALVAPIIVAVAISIAIPARPRLVWNASASVPVGLYAVTAGEVPQRGMIVIARVPSGMRSLAASRRYVPFSVPLVKPIGGEAGDTVCGAERIVTINGKPVASRRIVDGAGRRMPWWTGCRTVRPGELFLLAPDAPGSFDGRYFGVSPSTDIIGSARLLWAR